MNPLKEVKIPKLNPIQSDKDDWRKEYIHPNQTFDAKGWHNPLRVQK